MKAVFLLVLALALTAECEMRVWKDLAGNEYEAEFQHELFDKVTLRTADGKEHRLGVEELSDHDQKYLRVMVPPQIALDCKVSRNYIDPPWDLWHHDSPVFTRITAEVTVRKVSKRPFTSRLEAELYLVAREVDGENFILLSRTPSSFLLLNETHQFAVEPVDVRVYSESAFGNVRRGEEYDGYLLVVSDAAGRILETRTDLSDWICDPAVIANLRETALHGPASFRNRHFDKTGNKVKVPRPKLFAPVAR